MSPSSTSDAERLSRIALASLREPGDPLIARLVDTHGALDALHHFLTGFGPTSATSGAANAPATVQDHLTAAAAQMRDAAQTGTRLIIPSDAEWPTQLNDMHTTTLAPATADNAQNGAPLCLWVHGPASLPTALHRAVAVVGSRAATDYGTYTARFIAYDLASRGWTVANGGAFGIDTAALRGALSAGGVTIAVLPGGIDRPYPVANATLFDSVARTGALISPWPSGTAPTRDRITYRNQLAAMLTLGTVAVEASPTSGSITMLRHALAAPGRTAMAVPGPVTSIHSRGCHEALRTLPRTRLVTSAADILDLLNPDLT